MALLRSKAAITVDKAKALFGKKVESLTGEESKIRELISGVGQKLTRFKDNPKVQQLISPIAIFIRMIKAHFNGTRKLSGSTLGWLLLALVYFISPVDLIPDFLGFFGFADDLTVVLAIYAKLKDEVTDFLDWENTTL